MSLEKVTLIQRFEPTCLFVTFSYNMVTNFLEIKFFNDKKKNQMNREFFFTEHQPSPSTLTTADTNCYQTCLMTIPSELSIKSALVCSITAHPRNLNTRSVWTTKVDRLPNSTLPLKVENIHIIYSLKGKEKETYPAIGWRNSSLSIK